MTATGRQQWSGTNVLIESFEFLSIQFVRIFLECEMIMPGWKLQKLHLFNCYQNYACKYYYYDSDPPLIFIIVILQRKYNILDITRITVHTRG